MRTLMPALFFGLSTLFSVPTAAQIAVNDVSDTSGGDKSSLPVDMRPDTDVPSILLLADYDSGRAFQEQAFMLTDKPVFVGDAILTWHDWCGEIWSAQSLAGRPQDRETDAYVCHRWNFGKATLEGNVAAFDVPDLSIIWRFRAALSYPVSDMCTGTAYADVMRGGFHTEVVKGEAACSFPIWDRFSFSPTVQLSYDTKFDVVATGFNLGVDAKISDHWTGRVFWKGYQALSGHGPTRDDTGTIWGVQVGWHTN